MSNEFIAFPASAIILLAATACSSETPEPSPMVQETTDASGETLIRSDVDPNEVQVDLPETPMTPVPEGEAESEAETDSGSE